MPSKNPRLSVVLSPALAATLAALADASGESSSSVVRGLLEQSHSALDRLVHLMRAAKSGKAEIGVGVADTLNRVQSDLESALYAAEGHMSQVGHSLDLVSQAEAVKGRRSAGRGGRVADGTARALGSSTPVPVTRGSGRPNSPLSPVQKGKRVRPV